MDRPGKKDKQLGNSAADAKQAETAGLTKKETETVSGRAMGMRLSQLGIL